MWNNLRKYLVHLGLNLTAIEINRKALTDSLYELYQCLNNFKWDLMVKWFSLETVYCEYEPAELITGSTKAIIRT